MSVPTSNFLGVDVRVLPQETLQGLGFAAAPGWAYSKVGLVFFVAGIESQLVVGISGRRRRNACLSSLFSILFYPLRGNLLDNLLDNVLFIIWFEKFQSCGVC